MFYFFKNYQVKSEKKPKTYLFFWSCKVGVYNTPMFVKQLSLSNFASVYMDM